MIKLSVVSGLALSLTMHSISLMAQTEQLVNDGLERLKDNKVAQQTVSDLHEKTKALEDKYLKEMKLVEGLNMYNALLARQLNDQQAQITKLEASISNATLIERQIIPLLVRMVDALNVFVNIDMPFLLTERQQRVDNLYALLEQSDLTTSEKSRRVFEAYQIENEFGYTIESYKGSVATDNGRSAVEFLRIGRIALLYRDLSGDSVGYWDKHNQAWQPLTESQYKRHITKGLKIAREEIAPELITIPLVINKEVRQ